MPPDTLRPRDRSNCREICLGRGACEGRETRRGWRCKMHREHKQNDDVGEGGDGGRLPDGATATGARFTCATVPYLHALVERRAGNHGSVWAECHVVHGLHVACHARNGLLAAARQPQTQRVIVAAGHHALLHTPGCFGIALRRRQLRLGLIWRTVAHDVVAAQRDAVDPVAVHIEAAHHYSRLGIPHMQMALARGG